MSPSVHTSQRNRHDALRVEDFTESIELYLLRDPKKEKEFIKIEIR